VQARVADEEEVDLPRILAPEKEGIPGTAEAITVGAERLLGELGLAGGAQSRPG